MIEYLGNEPKRFGQLIRFHRIQKGLTLRQLEDALGRSHTWISLLEQGRIEFTPEMTESVSTTLGLALTVDFAHHQRFQTAFETMLERLIYGDAQALMTFLSQWVGQHTVMLSSIDVVDYLLAMALTAPYDEKGIQPWSTLDLIQSLEPLQAIMFSDQRFLWYLVKGRFELMQHHFEASRQTLDLALNEKVSPALQDLAAFYRVQALSQSYHLFEAMQAYETLIENFERRGQLHRAMEIKLANVMNTIRMHHLDTARTRLEPVADYVRQRGRRELFRPMIEIAMLLHLLLGDEETVLAYASELKVQSPRTSFYQAFAACQLKRSIERCHLPSKEAMLDPHATLFLRLTRQLTTPQTEQNACDYQLSWLSQAYKDFKTGDLIPEATLIYDKLKETLTQKRRYKEAYQVTADMIEMVKKMMN